MAKLPDPPPSDRLRALTPVTTALRAGTRLARVGFADGPHPARWNQFRTWGPGSLSSFVWPGCKSARAVPISADSWPVAPTTSRRIVENRSSRGQIFASPPKARQAAAARFDHHQRNAEGEPQEQERGVLYVARAAQTCLAEVFQDTRVVDVQQNRPYLAVWTLAADVILLDLTGVFATRMGASSAIHAGPRARAQRWAAALYHAYPSLDGIAYCSAMNGNANAYALTERALAKAPLPPTPDVHRMLDDPLIADLIDAAAADVGYLVRR